MVPTVASAVDEIRKVFPVSGVDAIEDGQGGAYVTVHGLDLGGQYQPRQSWLGFLLPYLYPAADVYPHFTDAAFVRVDGSALGEGFGQVAWQGQPATQISRRSNRWDPSEDTALIKLQKVLTWVRSR